MVCGLGAEFAKFVTADSPIYKRFYSSTVATLFADADELIKALSRQYDIIHLFGNVSSTGLITGTNVNGIAGTELPHFLAGAPARISEKCQSQSLIPIFFRCIPR